MFKTYAISFNTETVIHNYCVYVRLSLNAFRNRSKFLYQIKGLAKISYKLRAYESIDDGSPLIFKEIKKKKKEFVHLRICSHQTSLVKS